MWRVLIDFLSSFWVRIRLWSFISFMDIWREVLICFFLVGLWSLNFMWDRFLDWFSFVDGFIDVRCGEFDSELFIVGKGFISIWG